MPVGPYYRDGTPVEDVLPAFRRGMWDIAYVLGAPIFKVLYGLKCYGCERIPRKGPVILASNHQSFLDPFIVGLCCYPRPLSFMARKTLFSPPAFGTLIKLMNAFPIDLGGVGASAVREMLNRLKAGSMVLLFPEGTRTRDGSLGKVRGGLSLIVRESGAPVVPVYIHGAFEAWPRQRLLPRFFKSIRIFFGAAVSLRPEAGEGHREFAERVEGKVGAELRALQCMVRKSLRLAGI